MIQPVPIRCLVPLALAAGGEPEVPSDKCQALRERIVALRGTTVDFPNDDDIFHNVFSLSKTAPFDLGVYEPGHSRSVTMERTGLVRVYCNEDGSYVIPGVPDGSWALRAWNDRGVDGSSALRLDGGEHGRVDLELRETRRVLPHKNKFGKPYAEKYR